MKIEGAEFAAVLADAQRLGYAEADPTLDVDGHDAAHKTGILASLAHGFWVRPDQVHVEGIRNVTRLDIESAARLGYTIKLLGVIKSVMPGPSPRRSPKAKAPKPGILVAVYPALVRNDHVLASVNHAFNAIAVRGDMVGETLFYGRGAGGDPTASSVLSDIADAALDLHHGSHQRVPAFVAHASGKVQVVSMDKVTSPYYVRLTVIDRPGVFARIASVLAEARIGISSIIQPEGHEGATVPVILMLHDAPQAALARAIARIARLPVVKDTPTVIRVEDTAD
jgi:homoserine dehydrogenase